MNISGTLEGRRKEIGISAAELSRRTNITYDVLIRALKGKSNLKGDQFLVLCKELNLDFSDFDV